MSLFISGRGPDEIHILNPSDSTNQGVDLESLCKQIYELTGRYVSPDTSDEAELRAELETLQQENAESSVSSSTNSGNSSNVFALAAGAPIDASIPTVDNISNLETKTLEQQLEQLSLLQEASKIKLAGTLEQQEKAFAILGDPSLSGEEKLNQLKDIVKEIPLNDDPKSPQREIQKFIEDHPTLPQDLKDELEVIMYIPDPAVQTQALKLANTIMDNTSTPYEQITASLSLTTLLANYRWDYQTKPEMDQFR